MSGPADLQRRFYDMLMVSQYWPADRMQQHQRTQLGQLLRHAKANVPFYEHRLDAVLRPDGEIDWDRWNEMPVLDRVDLHEHRDAMQAKELPPGHGPVTTFRSSGSTGVPIETTHNYLEGVAGNAAMLRSYSWHDIDFDRSMLDLSGEDPDEAAWPEGANRGPWGPPWEPGSGTRFDLNKFTSPEHTADFLIAGDFAYFSAIPSRMEVVAYALRERGTHLPLNGLFFRGEALALAQRRLFEDVFGASCVDLYAATETFKMGNNCAGHQHFHVNAELGLIEIIDDAGRPAPVGTSGRVVVTPFYNTAQPLIRYAIGDIAVAGELCDCGRTLPVIDRVVGRSYHTFRGTDGRRFTPLVQEDESFDLGIGMWQLAQVAPGTAEFRYLMRPGFAADPTEIEVMLRRGLPSDFEIRLDLRQRFDLPADRKHTLLINEMDGAAR